MSWSIDAVRQAWRARERARVRMSQLAQAGSVADSVGHDYPSPMDTAIAKVSSILAPRYVVEVFNDFIIVEGDDDDSVSGPGHGSLYKVPYTVNDTTGTIDFAAPVPVQVEYVAKTSMSDLHRVLLSNPMKGVDVLYTEDRTGLDYTMHLTKDKKLVCISEH